MKFYQQKYFKPYHKIASDIEPINSSVNYKEFLKFKEQSYENSPSKKHGQRYRQESSSKKERYGQESSSKKGRNEHIKYEKEQQEPIWEHLYSQGMKSHKELMIRHQNSKHRIDMECTFQPIIKQNKRYLLPSHSTFLERVHVWQEHKIQKMVKEKEEDIDRGLKECTFTPQINQRSKRGHYEERQRNKTKYEKIHQKELYQNLNPYYSPIKRRQEQEPKTFSPPKKAKNAFELSEAKRLIRTELKRINI